MAKVVTVNMATLDKGTVYCVAVKRFENGLLKEVKKKEYFKKEEEATEFYNSLDDRGYRISLTVFINGLERTIREKNC